MANYKKIVRDNIVNENSTKKIADNITRNDIANFEDNSFFNTASISLDNNRYANSMFLNVIKDEENSDFSLSGNVEFNRVEADIRIKDLTTPADYYSTELCTDETYNSDLNYFFLLVNETVPDGCDIIYYLLTDDNRMFPLKPNGTTPLILKVPCKKFRLYCRLISNGIESPAINSYAVLYYDEYIESAYRLINLNLSDNDDNAYNDNDLITLVRDNTKDDKLVQVLTNSNKIDLIYDDVNDRLSEVNTYDIDTDNLSSRDLLIYGPYLNSQGIKEDVLQKIKVIRSKLNTERDANV